MKKLFALGCILSLAACTPTEVESAHSFVTASQIKTAEEMCKPNGGLSEINAHWCRGKGCSYSGYKIVGTCKGNTQGLKIEFRFSEDDQP